MTDWAKRFEQLSSIYEEVAGKGSSSSTGGTSGSSTHGGSSSASSMASSALSFAKKMSADYGKKSSTTSSEDTRTGPAVAAGGHGATGGAAGRKKRRKGPAMSGSRAPHDPEFAKKAETAVLANVRMISGCKDEQTSADVQDVTSFGLPDSAGAGGACTNALLSVAEKGTQHMSWAQLLKRMQAVLKTKKYVQVPQLSASRDLDLNQPFDLILPHSKRHKALLIGINYVGQQGELSGCHNDVEGMKDFILSEGYTDTPETMMILMDDGQHDEPTAAHIVNAFKWLVQGAASGDSLFLHYSGHGGNMPDDGDDEADGMDETMVPVDYQRVGQIRDDDIYKLLVAPLPEGVELTCVMDCCHSGSVFDLPYTISMSGDLVEASDAGEEVALAPNDNFSIAKVLKVGMELYKMSQQSGTTPVQLGQYAAKALGVDASSFTKMF